MAQAISLRTVDGGRQPVEVQALGDGRWRVLYTPGMVDGIAADDVIGNVEAEAGTFEVLERGGNVAIRLLAQQGDVSPAKATLLAELEPLGGRCDGAVAYAAIFTVPAAAGFEAIEAALRKVGRDHEGAFPQMCNVFDPDGQPLRWWE